MRSVCLSVGLLLLAGVSLAQGKFYDITEPEKLPQTINSNVEEGLPMLSPDGKTLYFVRTFHKNNVGGVAGGQDIWYSTRKNGRWTSAKNDLEKLNTEDNNAVTGISNDGSTMYLHGTYLRKDELTSGLSFVQKQDDGWSRPRYQHVPHFSAKSDHYSFFLDPHDRYMVISSKGKKSKGKEDLYVCLRNEKGRWGDPIHLGPQVNSSGFEISPFLDDNGRALYFASNGHDGFGSADIYVSYRLDETWTNWTEPKNLGPKVNSKKFDAYFSVHEDGTVFFCSNRDGELSDIYTAELVAYKRAPVVLPNAIPKTKVLDTLISVSGIFEYDGFPGDNVKLQLVDEDNTFVRVATTDENGNFTFEKLPQGKNYMVKVLEADADMQDDGELFIYDEKGTKQEEFQAKNTLVQLDSDYNAAEKVAEEDAQVEVVTGRFEYNSLPAANSMIELVDENGNVVDVIQTDANGNFEYEKLALNRNFILRMAEADAEALEDTKVFLVDEDGNKAEEATQTEEGGFSFQQLSAARINELSRMSDKDGSEILIIDKSDMVVVAGQFEYENLPSDGVKMNLLDEEEVVLHVTQTDSDGKFSFDNLEPNQDYIVTIAEDQNIPEDARLYLLDDDGNKVLLINQGENGKYLMRAYPKEELKALPKLEEKDVELISMEPRAEEPKTEAPKAAVVADEPKSKVRPKSKPRPKTTTKPVVSAKPTPVEEDVLGAVYFFNYEFNIWDLSEANIILLDNEIIPRLNNDPNLVLVVHGHADSEGSAQNNQRVSNFRALDVRQYLLSRLIESHRIITQGFGEDKPLVSNSTPEGRSKNRRVEMQLERR